MAPRFPFRIAVAAAALVSVVLSLGAARADDVAPPPGLLLPWQDGETWLTGISGFHGQHDALDFFPPDTPLSLELICEGEPGWYEASSAYWVLASAEGTVMHAERPLVLIAHEGGWSTGYYHVGAIQVEVGERVEAGEPIGVPTTYGACTTGPHVHFWALGPDGATTADVALSGVPAEAIGINAYISETGNAPPGATVPGALPGDADCDGDADTADALAAMREVAGMTHGAGCIALADADCSGAVESVDALAILRYAAALDSGLSACASASR